jgi:hypothetical protein
MEATVRDTRKTSSDDTSWVTSDQELLDLLQEGGLPAEHAGLELLLRRQPQRWEDAAGLLGSIDGASPTAVDALANAWRTFLRIEGTERGIGR